LEPSIGGPSWYGNVTSEGIKQPPPQDLIIQSLLNLGIICAQLVSPLASSSTTVIPTFQGELIHGVKTTAYTHTESDHIEYGARSAVGTVLHHSDLNSAAADWSIYPLGTIFQIEGDKTFYIVDDYGSALVGTKTIDIYQPSRADMDDYGARKVNIRVIRWGSQSKSLEVLRPRANQALHVRKMIWKLKVKLGLEDS
jgi:3D (Asp-Asp-Asp) domain-containing protein